MIPPSPAWVLSKLALAALFVFLVAAASPARPAPASVPDEPDRRIVNDRCPVMTDEFASPLHEVDFRGSTVRFCCRDCVERFEADSLPFLKNIPHLPPEVVQAATADAHNKGWTRPVFLSLAALLAVWVAARIRFLRRRVPVRRLPFAAPRPTASSRL